jgi:hypothetical protein
MPIQNVVVNAVGVQADDSTVFVDPDGFLFTAVGGTGEQV